MRSFWFGLFGFLVAVYGFNALVDVSGVNSFEKIYRLSKQQSPKQVLVWDKYFDQRPWLKARLDDAKVAPRVLILGSSTVGTMSDRQVKEVPIVNGWLTSNGLEDLEAVTAILERSPRRPEVIILGLDPWFFNARDSSENWRSLFGDFATYHRDHAATFNRFDLYALGASYRWQIFKERLNFSSTYEAALFVLRRWREHLSWEPALVTMEPDAYCDTVTVAPWIRAADGHYHICRNLRGITPATVEKAAETYVTKNIHFIAEWDRVDPDRLRRLQQMVQVWRSWNRQVVLLTPPVHPTAHAKMTAVPAIQALLREVDDHLAQLCRSSGAKCLQLRDPAVVGCDATQFRDGHHSDLACADRMMRRSLAEAGILPTP